MLKNFRFEEPGKIALSAAPQTADEVDWLHEQGIRTVVSLHPVGDAARDRMAELGIEWRRFPITGFPDGVPEGLEETLDAIRTKSEEAPVLIH